MTAHPLPARARRVLPSLACCLALALPRVAAAQLPGAPVLQNAFSNPGATVAVNYADGDGASLLGLAGAWAPGATGRFQLSAGIGRLTADGQDPSFAFGARVGVPLFSFAGGRAGLAPFVGLGGVSRDSGSVMLVPLGVGAGWRFALGSTRALSIYGTGTYLFVRAKSGDESASDGFVRGAIAADVTLLRRVGLTLGYEAGASAADGAPGPSGPIFAAGLSWALR